MVISLFFYTRISFLLLWIFNVLFRVVQISELTNGYLSIYLASSIFIHPSLHPFFYPSIIQSIVHLSYFYSPNFLSIYQLFIHPPAPPSFVLFIHPFIVLFSICPSFYPSIFVPVHCSLSAFIIQASIVLSSVSIHPSSRLFPELSKKAVTFTTFTVCLNKFCSRM